MMEVEDDNDNGIDKYQISSEESESQDNILIDICRLNLNKFLQTAQNLKHDSMKDEALQLVVTPIFQHVKLDQTFHIQSDFFFDLGFKKRKTCQEQILSFSHFKRILYTQHLPKQAILIMFMDNYQKPMREFSQLQQLLMKQPQKRLRILSKLLNEYKKVITNSEQQIQMIQIQRLLNYTNVEEKLYLREQFIEECLKKKFESYAKEGAFYSYCMKKANIDKGCFEINQQGYSDSLICLLGSDPQQFTSTVMRKGYPEIQAQRNRDIFNIGRLNFELFETNFTSHRLIGCDCSILTFDDQVINCGSIIEHYFFDFPPELQINGDQFKSEQALFVFYQISINQLKQIIATRQNNKYMENSDWINDFGYSVMSEILLEKYYKINENKKVNPEDQFLQPIKFGEDFFSIM